MSTRVRSLAVAFCCLSVAPVLAQAPGGDSPSPSLVADAASYAETFGVELEQAVRRLQLQDEAGALAADLVAEDDFAGLWIEHEPFKVVVRFRGAAAARARLEDRVRGTRLAGFVELRAAAHSLAQLEQLLELARHRVQRAGVRADAAVDVRANAVRLFVLDARGLERALAAAGQRLPPAVEVEEVAALSEPVTTVVGGVPATTCTWGFTVRRSNGDVGVSTAAHCGNSQAYAGVGLPFRTEDQQGNQDVQWHSACDVFDVSNQFQSGIGLRSCIGTRSRDQQAVGSLVWKNGMTSGRTWGVIESKSFAPWWVTSAASTFIYVDGEATGMDNAEPGDSGSPVFVEDLAYGILIGHNTTSKDAIYMPINYISSLGVSVLTFDPPADCRICGDGHCEAGESCTIDCDPGPVCGDGECEPGESCFSDCGSECPPCIVCPCDDSPFPA